MERNELTNAINAANAARRNPELRDAVLYALDVWNDDLTVLFGRALTASNLCDLYFSERRDHASLYWVGITALVSTFDDIRAKVEKLDGRFPEGYRRREQADLENIFYGALDYFKD